MAAPPDAKPSDLGRAAMTSMIRLTSLVVNEAAIKRKSRLGNSPASTTALLRAAERRQPMSEIGHPTFVDPVSLVRVAQR